MMKRFESILSLYEDFLTHKGVLSGGEGFFDYMAPSSRHSDITCFAYGIRKTMSCIDISRNPAQSVVVLEQEQLSRRFYLKLTACLFDWESYTCGIEVAVNGQKAYENGKEFFENVNLGWPTVYIPIDSKLLQPGENILELRQTGGKSALLVGVMDLVSLPGMEVAQQTAFCSVARKNTPFTVGFFTDGETLAVLRAEGCRVLETVSMAKETLIRLEAWQENPVLQVMIGGKAVNALLPEMAERSEDICLVGTDSDDHRHDDSDETDRIIDIFTNTAMGDFWQARPQHMRNYHDLSSREVWEKRIGRLKAFGARISQADGNKAMPWLSELCGESFIGRHFHEAYLYFCSALERAPDMAAMLQINIPKMRGAQSFGESKELFVAALDRMYKSCQDNPGLTSVGSPSLLTVYEARAGFERVTIEPVSNIALLIGAVRGAAPRQWGAHVPTDWYFGEPNDDTKSKKFLLAMQLLYINGADYIYAENSLFKTNAFSREDWEDRFCVLNRQYQREFFAYKQANPREGLLQRDLAVIYGNNEFFLWHHDDRIAELPENGDWDQKLWGKWEDNRHHKLWRAIDAWMPLAKEQHSKKNVLNLDLFSGTPYGPVDVVPYDGDYSQYKAVALLGWNTCVDGFAQKLRHFVEAGGCLFVSGCHFNRTDRCDLPFAYDTAQLKQLLGVAPEETVSAGGMELMCLEIPAARKLLLDETGNVLVWEKSLGKGKLYFGTFADYNCTARRMEAMEEVLRRMGSEYAQAVCDDPNISFTLRQREDGGQTLDVLNVCAASDTPRPYTLRLRSGQEVRGEARPCRIVTHKL